MSGLEDHHQHCLPSHGIRDNSAIRPRTQVIKYTCNLTFRNVYYKPTSIAAAIIHLQDCILELLRRRSGIQPRPCLAPHLLPIQWPVDFLGQRIFVVNFYSRFCWTSSRNWYLIGFNFLSPPISNIRTCCQRSRFSRSCVCMQGTSRIVIACCRSSLMGRGSTNPACGQV